ncbi:MAG: ClpXP protease specificity-enhancing factor [Betaproteobacteria bacterium]|nr:ClpXP protease specificity-enhancing factor [Betaproteobacteria bacterium]
MNTLPQQPYFLRALYEWCVDSGYTPHITVRVDGGTRVPVAYVQDGQIVLNIGPNAVRNLLIDNVWVSFSARFGGVSQEIQVPIANVMAIYARETGEGMAFGGAEDAVAEASEASASTGAEIAQQTPAPSNPSPKGRSHLRLVK